MMTRNECARWLRQRNNFCILTHYRPDGDAIGSAAALCLGLRKLGKAAFVLENPEITEKYGYLVEGMTIAAPDESHVLMSVDVAAENMVPRAFADYLPRLQLRIDHHASPASFTPFELVDPGAAACAEIVYDLLMELDVALDPAIGRALYVGASTDTGCFRFANTTAHSFAVAAACAEAGAPVFELNQALFETNSLAKLRLQGWIVEHTRFFADGKIAICAIPRAVEEGLGVSEDDLGNVSSFVRTIEGVCMAATVRERKEGGAKASVRAVPGWDAAAVCEKFGGGGHKGAAGARFDLPLEEAARALEEAMMEI